MGVSIPQSCYKARLQKNGNVWTKHYFRTKYARKVMVPDPQQQLIPPAVRALHCILSHRAPRLKVQCLTQVLFLVRNRSTPHPLVRYCWGPFRKTRFKNNEGFKNTEGNPLRSSLNPNMNFWNKSLLGAFGSFVTRKMTKQHKTASKRDW